MGEGNFVFLLILQMRIPKKRVFEGIDKASYYR